MSENESGQMRALLFQWKIGMCKKPKRHRDAAASFAKQFRELVANGGINAQHAAVEVGLEQVVKILEKSEPTTDIRGAR